MNLDFDSCTTVNLPKKPTAAKRRKLSHTAVSSPTRRASGFSNTLDPMVALKIDEFKALRGMGLVPAGRELANLPDDVFWRKSPQLSEEAVRDLLMTHPKLLEAVLGLSESALRMRELYRADIVALDNSGCMHVVELKHHEILRGDSRAMAQLLRHRERVRESLVGAQSTRLWLITSGSADGRPVDGLREGLEVRRFAEFTQCERGRDIGPTWLAFETSARELDPVLDGRRVPVTTAQTCPGDDDSRVIARLRAIVARLPSKPGFDPRVPDARPNPNRRMWALYLIDEKVGKKHVYATLEYYRIEGGPFLALACSAAVADCVAEIRLGVPSDGAARQRHVARTLWEIVESGAPDQYSGPVEHDDGLLRWYFTPAKPGDDDHDAAMRGIEQLGLRFGEAL